MKKIIVIAQYILLILWLLYTAAKAILQSI
jgi:hypothetical protein